MRSLLLTRRSFLTTSSVLSGAACMGLPLIADAEDSQRQTPARKLRVVVVGGHPDDPESGCGGTIARYSDLGHEVVSLYLTRGEAGIEGKAHEEAAKIRTAESLAACRILKARPVFAGQIDGSSEVNSARYQQMRALLQAEMPDIVFTHWPVDSHRDHRAASLLVYDALVDSFVHGGKPFVLYYFEVMSGSQTQQFSPTHYVDITSTESRKRAACMAHHSQRPEDFYAVHEQMQRFRGMQCLSKYAEAFVRYELSPKDSPLDDTIWRRAR